MFLQAAKRLGPLREASCSWTARGLHAPAAAAGKEAPPRSGGPAQPAKGGKASRKTERPKPSLGFQVSPCAGRSASREAQHWAKRLRGGGMFGGLHGSPLAGAAGEEGVKEDDVAQQIVEKGSKRLMGSDEGRETLRDGTFDMDKTADAILQEGTAELEAESVKDPAAGEAAQAAQAALEGEEGEGVKQRVKERVLVMNQAD